MEAELASEFMQLHPAVQVAALLCGTVLVLALGYAIILLLVKMFDGP